MANKTLIILLIFFQALALIFFTADLLGSIFGIQLFAFSWTTRELIEIVSFLGLLFGFLLSLVFIRLNRKRIKRVEEQLSFASEAFHRVLQDKFVEWSFTDAEKDVALLIIKGFSISEIAELRKTSVGTIKAQNSSIYLKSKLSGRVQFVSYFLEELSQPL